MKYNFGPDVCHTFLQIGNYICDKLNIQDVIFRDFDSQKMYIEKIPKSGTYVYKNVQFEFDIKSNFHVYERGFLLEGYLTISGEDKVIKEILDQANCSVKKSYNENCIKVYINDYIWRLHDFIKKRKFENIYLPEKIVDEIVDDLNNFISGKNDQLYEKLSIPKNRIYMFYGPPGTGKTSLINAIASKFNKNLCIYEFNCDTDDKMLRKNVSDMPVDSILCIEDIDCLFSNRKDYDTAKNGITFSGLLNSLDGLCRLEDKIIIMTTNVLDTIDDAIKRRVNYFVKFDYNTRQQTLQQYKNFFPNGDNFDELWDIIKTNNLKVTPNIIEKYFIRNLDGNLNNFKDFVLGEYQKEEINIYT